MGAAWAPTRSGKPKVLAAAATENPTDCPRNLRRRCWMLTVLPPSWSLSARDKPIDAGRCKDYCINDRRAWLLVLADFRRQERRHSHSTFILRAADCVAVDAVTREPCSARIFPLLTGKNTGNFAFSGASNCALLLGN